MQYACVDGKRSSIGSSLVLRVDQYEEYEGSVQDLLTSFVARRTLRSGAHAHTLTQTYVRELFLKLNPTCQW